jgi:hypothetical protein
MHDVTVVAVDRMVVYAFTHILCVAPARARGYVHWLECCVCAAVGQLSQHSEH